MAIKFNQTKGEAKKESYSGAEYTSSKLITKGKFNFKYGRIDARAKLQEGQGMCT